MGYGAYDRAYLRIEHLASQIAEANPDSPDHQALVEHLIKVAEVVKEVEYCDSEYIREDRPDLPLIRALLAPSEVAESGLERARAVLGQIRDALESLAETGTPA